MKKVFAVMFMCALLISNFIFLSISMNNKEIHYNDYNMGNIAIKKQGEYYISLREFFEELHYTVDYDDVSNKIIIFNNRDYIEILDEDNIKFNNKVFNSENIYICKGNRLYISLDSLENIFKFKIKYNGNVIDIKGINIYKLDINSNEFYIYNEEKIYRIPIKSLSAESLIQLSKDVSGNNKVESQIDTEIIESLQSSIKPRIIREVYRTNEGNDVIELYQYLGENIYPLVTDIYFSYDAAGYDKPYVVFDNMGLVLTFDRMLPSEADLEYFRETYSRHNFEDNMLAFYDIPVVVGETKGRIQVYDDSESLENNYKKSIPRSLTYSAYYNEEVDIPTHIISLDKENIVVSERTINSEMDTENIEKYHYTNGMLDEFIAENNIVIDSTN